MNKTIITVKGQTIDDIAIQEYGNVDATAAILADNPNLKNEYPASMESWHKELFDFAYPLVAGQSVSISDNLDLEKKLDRSFWGRTIISA